MNSCRCGRWPYLASDTRASVRVAVRSAGSRAGSARRSEPLPERTTPTRSGLRAGGCSSGLPSSPPGSESLGLQSLPRPAHVRAAARRCLHLLNGPPATPGRARQFSLRLRRPQALHCLRTPGLHDEVDDALAELAVGRVLRCHQRPGDLGPGLQVHPGAWPETRAPTCASQATCLFSPRRRVVAPDHEGHTAKHLALPATRPRPRCRGRAASLPRFRASGAGLPCAGSGVFRHAPPRAR